MMKSILLYDLYLPNCEMRRRDLDECWDANSKLDFSTILLYGDKTFPLLPGRNIIHTGDNGRLTFSKFLSVVNSNRTSDGIAVLTNSDIKLDKSLISLVSFLPPGILLAITRYESNGMIAVNPWCTQDTWVLRLQPIHAPLITAANFYLGSPGCELRFAELMYSAGFLVFNPSISIVNHHIHSTVFAHRLEDSHFGAYIFTPPCTMSDITSTVSEQSGKVFYLRKGEPIKAIS